ncbi:uncharacterized protein C17orf67 homolog isoform X2 [Sciurus carolinensis]|uniref:uncharacterized protein C17orf67 homolog isoform X2 n=1 Tax=Sciurus carolinensis TaxID=30640 RepID=UPI001FB46526|nr:uncharacterized protein C17orf67 homolog isoform X2 [Sciurus carolinensis]
MRNPAVFLLAITILAFLAEASPILTEKQAKQLLRSRRQDRPSKPGFPDEPMRESTLAIKKTSGAGGRFHNGGATCLPGIQT